MDDTWLIVADASRARIFATDYLLHIDRLVEEMVNDAGRAHERDLVSDDRGRTQAFPGGERSAMEPAGHREKEVQRFAKAIGERLERARLDKAYERLVVVAPPQFLGTLREALPRTVAEMVQSEVAKDYVHASQQELTDLVRNSMEGTPLLR